jgi:hypothetical protein
MSTRVDHGVSTDREILLPFLVMDLPDPSSAGEFAAARRRRVSEPEPVLSDTSLGTTTIWAPNGLQRDLDTIRIYNATGFLDTVKLHRHPRLLAESVITSTMIAPKAFNISGRVEEPEEAAEATPSLSDEISAALAEVTELLSVFLENVPTDELQDRCEVAISGIIDRYGQIGIRVLERRLVGPALEPLFWRFLTALGARRSEPIDQIAKEILLRHLNSPSGGRRAAAASALGAICDGAVLAALERRAAIEQNRMVKATLHAHIRTLNPHALPPAKIL